FRRPTLYTLFPYTTLFRSHAGSTYTDYVGLNREFKEAMINERSLKLEQLQQHIKDTEGIAVSVVQYEGPIKESIIRSAADVDAEDRKSTRLNSSHVKISYA